MPTLAVFQLYCGMNKRINSGVSEIYRFVYLVPEEYSSSMIKLGIILDRVLVVKWLLVVDF